MKALPLWQPWASLVAIGAKRIETRHWAAWPSLIGQRVAIHATKKTSHLDLTYHHHFAEALKAGRAAGTLALIDGKLPLGHLLGTVVLDRCTEMTEESILALEQRNPREAALGLYEPGRFAWVLRDPEPLAEPVPFIGRQGIFDVPDDLSAVDNRPRGHARDTQPPHREAL